MFWAVATRWHFSRAPRGPRNRRWCSPKIRIRWGEQHPDLFAQVAEDRVLSGPSDRSPCRSVCAPIRLRRRVLPVCLCLNGTGVGCKALAACHSPCDAARDDRLDQMAQHIAVTEATMPVSGKLRMVRHRGGQIETVEPAVYEVGMDVRATAPLRAGPHDITGQPHPDHSFGTLRPSHGATEERCN